MFLQFYARTGGKKYAPGEARTHDLQITLGFVTTVVQIVLALFWSMPAPFWLAVAMSIIFRGLQSISIR